MALGRKGSYRGAVVSPTYLLLRPPDREAGELSQVGEREGADGHSWTAVGMSFHPDLTGTQCG